ncbi:ATP-dependent rRNA helicase spb4 [Coemansia interrupta]|uniref:ATP-dependent RNA helicase n=1 Tax=Coemansia interrupta TaxID=1126814 RepID=A0A9W8LLQ7_9FUNG|nr:ATP-dependent rRNA helicase spb4 [Coemansia interrupta]
MADSVVPTFGGTWDAVRPPLPDELLSAVSSLGFERMTPVQEAAIPAFLQNSDVIVEAATGSGKTLSFALPLLVLLQRATQRKPLAPGEIGALVVSPTRELAKQTFGVLSTLLELSGLPFKALLVVGGSASATDTADEMARVREGAAHILVGTPGRLEDVVCGRMRGGSKRGAGVRGRPSVRAARLEVLVLDEADRLLDLGFEASLTAILAALPKQRRTGLFSATMSEALGQLVRAGLRNPVRVQVQVRGGPAGDSSVRIPSTLQISYLVCPPDRKMAQLLRLIRLGNQGADEQRPSKYIVYFSTCAAVEYFYRVLRRLLDPKPELVPGGQPGMEREQGEAREMFADCSGRVAVHSLHGQMVQKKRQMAFDAFTALPPAATGVLLATDLASRGLDIPDVDCVVQWDPPTDPKSFAHRCGRTARAGRSGRALVFLNPGAEETYVDFLAVRKIPMAPAPYLWLDAQGTVTTEPPADAIMPDPVDSDNGDSDDDDEHGDEAEPKKRRSKKRRVALAVNFPTDSRSTALLDLLRRYSASDREIYGRSSLAFVSFVQAYAKHEAAFIFRLKELPLVEAAQGFALLHLPSMPELRGRPTRRFVNYPVDTDTIPYLDAQREAQRQVRLARELEEKAKEANKKKKKKDKAKNEAWSSKKSEREKVRELKIKRLRQKDERAREREEEMVRRINDPEVLEALRLDPLLAKRMLSGRDKSLRDAVALAADRRARGAAEDARTLEQIVQEARELRARARQSSGSESSSDEEEDWEAVARRERIAKKMAARGKRPRFEFNPGFSDEEEKAEGINVPQGYSWAEFIDYDGHNLYFANLTHLSLDFSNDPTDTIHPNHRIAAKTLRYMLHFPKLQHLSIANCPPRSPLFSSQKYFTSVPHISIDGSLASVSHATDLGLQCHKRVGVRLAGAVEGDEDQRIVYRVLNYYFATLEVERKAELTLDVGLDRLDVSKIRWANLTSLVLASVFKVDCLLRLMFALPNVTTLAAYRLDIKLYSLFVGHDFGDDMHDSSKMLTGSSTASWFPQIKLGFYFSYVRNLVSTQKELQRVFRFLPVSAISPVPTTRIKMLALYFDETSPGTLDLKTEILVYILAKVGCLQAAHVDPVFRIPLDLLATHLQPMCPHLADIWVNYIPAGLSKDTKIFV